MEQRAWMPWLVALMTLSAACSQIPTQELTQYRTAFSQGQSASEAILIDFDSALTAAEKRKSSAPPPPVHPKPFSTELAYGSPTQPSAVEVRRTALRTIDKFNNVLTTLAEGKSVAALQTTVGGFVEAAQNFAIAAGGNAVPGLSALTGAVKTLASELEKARLRKEFEKAVRAGAPTINRMLEALIDERIDHLTLRADEANLRQIDIVDEITTRAAALRSLIRDHSAPANDDPLKDLQLALDEALKPAEAGLTFSLPMSLSYQTGKPALTESDQLLATQLIGEIKERTAAFTANAEQYEAFRSALNNYGSLLRTVQQTLSALVDALDRPQKFEQASEELFAIVFSLKKDIDAYRAARKSAD